MAKETIVSPIMTVRYAYLITPSTTYKENGEYSVKCAMEDNTPEAEAFKAVFNKLLADNKAAATGQLKPAQKQKLIDVMPWSREEDMETGVENGFIAFNFAMPAKVIRKSDQKVFEFDVDLFDSAGNPISKEARKGMMIGAGSKIQVSFTADRPYCMESKGLDNKPFYKYGVSTDLKAVMIHKLATSSQTATGYGFAPTGEGFKHEAPEAPENPFVGGDVPPNGDL